MVVTTIPMQPRSVALRPLALPTEHGGWGFLLEPIALGLLVAPSWSGALIATAAVFAFLGRHPLKLALQDAKRARTYPRTPYCWMLAATYLIAAALALASAIAIGGGRILIPIGIVAPLAVIQVLYDARNRSRELLPEMSGAAAMSSIAAAMAIAGGMRILPSIGLAGILIARSLPAILYVRALLRPVPTWPAVAMHVFAIAVVTLVGSPFAIAAMILLLVRAIWGFTHERPSAKTIGWREIVFGAMTVALIAIGYARI